MGESRIAEINEVVKELLKDDERCRNDDKWLVFRVMQRYTKIFIPFNDFSKLPSFETITRVRRKIQHIEGLYPPTDQTAINRRNREKEFRVYFKRGNEVQGNDKV